MKDSFIHSWNHEITDLMNENHEITMGCVSFPSYLLSPAKLVEIQYTHIQLFDFNSNGTTQGNGKMKMIFNYCFRVFRNWQKPKNKFKIFAKLELKKRETTKVLVAITQSIHKTKIDIFQYMRQADICMCRFHCICVQHINVGTMKMWRKVHMFASAVMLFLTTQDSVHSTVTAVNFIEFHWLLGCSNFHCKHCCRFQTRAEKKRTHTNKEIFVFTFDWNANVHLLAKRKKSVCQFDWFYRLSRWHPVSLLWSIPEEQQHHKK